MLKRLHARRSVLDFSLEEINRLKTLVPSDARSKLNIHSDAIATAEASLVSAINAQYPRDGAGGMGGVKGAGGAGGADGVGGRQGGTGGSGSGGAGPAGPTGPGVCMTKPMAPSGLVGGADPASGSGSGNAFGNDAAKADDAPVLAQVGKAHLDVLKAAFVCDLIRVGTFQWASATNHVGFALYPGDTKPYQHYPASHRIGEEETIASERVEDLNPTAVFLYNVQRWYFQQHAQAFAEWKTALDGYGNNLLDFTCVPFLTELRATGNARSNMPAMLIGGKQLGFRHNRYSTNAISINQLWGTIAQAYGYTSPDAPFAAPEPGFWTKPT